jgi:hypothetical protein
MLLLSGRLPASVWDAKPFSSKKKTCVQEKTMLRIFAKRAI